MSHPIIPISFIGVLLLSPIVFILSRYVIIRIREKGGARVRAKVRIVNCVFVLVILLICYFFLGSYSRRSQVDITPLEHIAAKPLYDLEYLQSRLLMLEQSDGVINARFSFSPDTVYTDSHVGVCNYSMSNPSIPSDLYVLIDIYYSTEGAMERFNSARGHNLGKRRTVNISEDIDVLLCNSITKRAVDELVLEKNSRKNVETTIRVGNIVLSFSENESVYTEIGALTSKNIKLICDVMFMD
jgi:hypothetical protein